MEALASQSSLVALLVFIAGLGTLLFSAKYFVDGIAALAEAAGVPPLIVGMTVVAFGTSTPELVVNSLAAWRGETALAFGNIVGSCTLNVGFVLAVTAIFKPMKVEPSLITREVPMLWVAVAALLILASDRQLSGGVVAADTFGRADGLVLLLLFGIFLYYTAIYSIARRALTRGTATMPEDAFMAELSGDATLPRLRPNLARHALVAAAGLVGVSLGADWTVDGATSMARVLGLSENLIGLTIVSFGTTLPELVTCILAARRGNADIALGNVVGSNLFNILAVGGIVSAISPMTVPPGGHYDLWFMALLSVVLLPIAVRSGQTITRGEGVFLLLLYVAFLGWRLSGA